MSVVNIARFACLALVLSVSFRCLSPGEPTASEAKKPTAELLLSEGNEARQGGDFRRAINLFQQASQRFKQRAEINEDPAAWAEYVSCLNQMAWDHMVYFGEFADAEKVLFLAAKVAVENLAPNHRESIRQKHNLAVLRYYENKLDEALEINREILVLRQTQEGDQRRALAATHNNLGLVYRARGELAKARVHYQRGLDLKHDALGDDHLDLATSYHNLGHIQWLLGAHEAGLQSLKRAHTLRTKHMPADHPDVGATAFTYGKALLDYGDAPPAFALIDEAIRIQKVAYGDDHPHTAHSSWEKARILVSQGLFEEAEAGLTQALVVFEKHFGKGNYHLADNLHYLGWLYWKKGEFDQSLDYFQQALAVFDDNDLYSHGWISVVDEAKIRCHRAIATVGISRYLEEGKATYLSQALAAIHKAVEVLTQARRRVLTEATQLVLARQGRDVLSLGVDVTMELFEKTGEVSFLEQAFLFAEESKMTILLDAIRNVEMQGAMGLTEGFLKREKSLRQKGYQLDTEAAHQVKNGEDMVEETRRKLIQHNLEVEQMLEELETAFPKYFSLKYQQKSPDMETFYALVEGGNRALVAYFIHGQVLTTFVLRDAKQLFFRQLSLNGKSLAPRFRGNLDWLTHGREEPGLGSLQTAISQLRSSMVFEKQDVFRHYAHQLHQKLVAPIDDLIAQRDVWIIPDGPLAFLPFEVLVSSAEASTGWDFPYFIKEHGISYAYAASLIDQKPGARMNLDAFRGVAFAPGFSNKNPKETFSSKNEASLSALPHSLTEVADLGAIFEDHGGHLDIWTEDAAKVETFRQVVSGGNFIHLATHARIDEEYPALSRLFFADAGDAGMLYLGDLFGLDMDADLVVLSACETGRGRMMRGEGVMGFVRGLFFAGARRVLVSQWQVADTSTAPFMTSFYEKAFSGMTMEEALRHVKIQQIETGQAPYAWAGFVLHSRTQYGSD